MKFSFVYCRSRRGQLRRHRFHGLYRVCDFCGLDLEAFLIGSQKRPSTMTLDQLRRQWRKAGVR